VVGQTSKTYDCAYVLRSSFSKIFTPLDYKCPKLEVGNGEVKLSGHRMGDLAMYFCDEGHHLFGNQVRECEENGTWSEAMATCVGK